MLVVVVWGGGGEERERESQLLIAQVARVDDGSQLGPIHQRGQLLIRREHINLKCEK